jgi:hypothetical protein
MENPILNVAYALLSLMRPGSGMYGDFSSQSAVDRAERENLELVKPESNELQIDIDNVFGMAIYRKNMETFQNFYTVLEVFSLPSKSGLPNKHHITITLAEKVDPTERLLLQMFLGSDLTREFLGYQRVKVGDPVPTLFLEKKPTIVEAPIDDIPF